MASPTYHRIVLRCLAFAACLSGALVAGPGGARAIDVVEETAPLAVTIDGRAERLETLTVHPVGAGRFPIALIANGAFPNPSESHPSGIAHLAHDFAQRGYLAAVVGWRGYGSSSGALQNEAGTCTAPDPKRFLDAHAADLAAALAALRTRPDTDPKIAVGLGISIGGASMLDLAAAPDRPLAAVVSISGGLYHGAKLNMPGPACGPFEAELVRAFETFGAAHVPTLWIYAENDPWFRPSLVRAMDAAYRRGGGMSDLHMLPPVGDDGHKLFKWEASAFTEPLIDRFLRANRLPALPDDAGFAALSSALGPDDRDILVYYLRMPAEKALAVPDGGSGAYLSYAEASIGIARRVAMDRCEAASRAACHLAAEDQEAVTASQGGPGGR